MDEEDIADAEEARKLQTTESFAGIGPENTGSSQNDSFMDILRTTGDTMGVKLLKKMGWRDGQGVGPKVERKARLDDDQDQGEIPIQGKHMFAPENSRMISFVRKDNRKGLGFEREEGLAENQDPTSQNGAGDISLGRIHNSSKEKQHKPERKGGFGVGILNDNGSDDEDPYQVGPQISYNRIVGGNKKKKTKLEAGQSAANPLLNSKPIFISKKAAAAKGTSGFRRCHDGRLPVSGFVLSSKVDPLSSIVSQDGKYPPPAIPENWKSSKAPAYANVSATAQSSHPSSAMMAAASKLSPKSRATILGETQLPGKSIFDYLTPAARDRIAAATNNQNLPPALSEAATHASPSQPRTLQSLVPALARETALTALGRGTVGWMPYAEDPAKRARYRLFLEVRASLRPEGTLPDRVPGSSNDDWSKEMHEFAHAAQIFKPMTGMMATRFTSSSSAPKLASDNVKLETSADSTTREPELLTQPSAKAKNPDEEAAAVGMYGPLTRSSENFYPTRLLCKRFNIKPPAHVQVDPGDAPPAYDSATENRSKNGGAVSQTHSTALPQKRLELIGKKDMDDLRMSGGMMRKMDLGRAVKEEDRTDDADIEQGRIRESAVIIDPERNEALEKERPGEAVFRAIFGSDSEED